MPTRLPLDMSIGPLWAHKSQNTDCILSVEDFCVNQRESLFKRPVSNLYDYIRLEKSFVMITNRRPFFAHKILARVTESEV